MIDGEVGAALNRDISRGEHVEQELDAIIRRRDRERRKTEGERAEEAAWAASERRVQAAKDAELRLAWAEFHRSQARRHRVLLEGLVAYHEARAKRYMSPPMKGSES